MHIPTYMYVWLKLGGILTVTSNVELMYNETLKIKVETIYLIIEKTRLLNAQIYADSTSLKMDINK